jgi:peptidoglycan/LPS O-acetylase OafA/YrhL
MSYSYYLIHGLTLRVLWTLLERAGWLSGNSLILFWALLPVGSMATCAVSAVLFLLVERRFSLVIAAQTHAEVLSPRTAVLAELSKLG